MYHKYGNIENVPPSGRSEERMSTIKIDEILF
jgi:hypothetical protein